MSDHATFGRARRAASLSLALVLMTPLAQAHGHSHDHSVQSRNVHVLRIDGPGRAVCESVSADEARDRFGIGNRRREGVQGPKVRYLTASGEITVDFIGFSAEAQAAFQMAVEIWSQMLELEVPIHVEALFEPLAPGVLGSAGPNGVFLPPPGSDLPAVPPSLVDQITGQDQLGPGVPDIEASFNSNNPDFYFGLDANPPPNQFDFLSVVLHELAHGLGFTSTFDIPSPPGNSGSYGAGPNDTPLVFDIFVADGAGQLLTDPTDFANPSPALATALTGGDIFFTGPEAVAENGGQAPELYAPTQFSAASSTAHWDEDVFPEGSPNALMTPFVFNGEAMHDPGPATIGLMRDLGYEAQAFTQLFIPQFGDGAGLVSEIVVFNPSGQPVQGTVRFFNELGQELDAGQLVPGGTDFNLPQLGTVTLATTGAGQGVTAGSATIEANGGVSGIIRFSIPGSGVAGVGSAESLTRAIAPVRRQGTLSTGVAFRNTSGAQITVDLTLKDEAGNVVPGGTAQVVLPVNARDSRFIQEIFPGANTSNFSGSICLEAQSGTFAAVALELQIGSIFTTLPVSPLSN